MPNPVIPLPSGTQHSPRVLFVGERPISQRLRVRDGSAAVAHDEPGVVPAFAGMTLSGHQRLHRVSLGRAARPR